MFGVYTHFSDQVKADQYHITKDLVKKIDLVEKVSVGKLKKINSIKFIKTAEIGTLFLI